MTIRDKLFSFEGRLRRRDWWLLNIGLIAVQFGGSYAVVWAFAGEDFAFWLAAADPLTAPYLAIGALDLALIWPNLALTAKRAQDRDRDPGLALGLMILSYLLAYSADFLPDDAFAVVMVPAGLIGLWLLLYLGLPDGTPGPNRYGPSPKHSLAEVF